MFLSSLSTSLAALLAVGNSAGGTGIVSLPSINADSSENWKINTDGSASFGSGVSWTAAGAVTASTFSGTAANITAASNSTITTLSALTSVSTLTTGALGTGFTAVGIAQGGTGHTTALTAFNALSPLTTAGDTIYGGTSGSATRIGIGTAAQLYIVNSGATAPQWASMSGDATITSSGAVTVATHAVTYAKMQQASTVTLLGNPTGGTADVSEITLGSGLAFSGSTLTASGSGGTVTSVSAAGPTGIFTWSAAVTGSGTLTATLATQSANLIFAGPASGSAAAPTFRSLVSLDIPNNAANTTGTAANITATSNSTLTALVAGTVAIGLGASKAGQYSSDVNGNLAIASYGTFTLTPGSGSVHIAGQLSLAGSLAMATNSVTGVADPVNPQDAATKHYVDSVSTSGSAASLSISGQSGLLTFTGLASTNRIKTVRDAADTLLELGGGSYTPTGTWVWTSASVTWPTFNQNTSGSAGSVAAANITGTTLASGVTASSLTSFGANPTITAPSITFSTSASVSAAGTNQGTATALTSDVNDITTVGSGSGVVLPSATAGRRIVVINKGANALNIYPASSAYIDGLSQNAAISCPINNLIEFEAVSTTQWYSSVNYAMNAGGLVGTVGIANGGTGQTTANAGFNALSPLTTAGDILYGGASGAGTRLAIGTAGQFLTVNGGATAPQWTTTLGTANGGTGVANNASSTITISGAYGLTLTLTASTGVTLPTSGTLLANNGNGGSLIFGTGSLSLGGSVAFTGAFTTNIAVTAATNITLPTSGTLVNTSVATLSSLTSIGTIGTGVWQGTVVGSNYGGTGVANGASTLTLAASLTQAGAFATTITSTAATNSTLPAGTHTLAGLDVAQSFTATQTFASINVTTTNTTALVAGPSSGAGTVKGIFRGVTSETADLLQLQNVNSIIFSGFDVNGQLYGYGTNWTLNNLSVPAAPTITNSGTTGSTTYTYTVTASNSAGETVASAGGSTTTGNATLTSTNKNIVTITYVNGATSYNVYRTVGGATQGKIGTITPATTVLNDTGLTASGSSPTAPAGNALTLQGWKGMTAAVFQIEDYTGAVNFSITAAGIATGNGSGLTNLNGSNISSGTVANAYLPTNLSLVTSIGPTAANLTINGYLVAASSYLTTVNVTGTINLSDGQYVGPSANYCIYPSISGIEQRFVSNGGWRWLGPGSSGSTLGWMDTSGNWYLLGALVDDSSYVGSGKTSLNFNTRLAYAANGTTVEIDYTGSQNTSASLSFDASQNCWHKAAINSIIAQTTYNGSVGGSATWTMVFQGSGFKIFRINYQALHDAGGTIAFPTAFTNTPYIFGDSAATAITTASTTTLTIAAAVSATGNAFVIGS